VHTSCLYNLFMAVFTVRLRAVDEKAIRALRADGVPIADLFRSAIQREYEARTQKTRSPAQVRELIASIDAAHPIPPGIRRPPVDTLDRKAMREFIVAKLKNKGRK
jgi:hypothetical protein